MYFFSADHHFFHKNIIKYCNRPFSSLEEMHEELIKRHNEVVSPNDTTIFAGDFSFASKGKTEEIIKRLNGNKVFLNGCHDKWLRNAHEVWAKRIDGTIVTVCHWCMRTWPASHYNSFHLFGHSHGKLEPIGKSLDIGVDTNNYYPYSWAEIENIMRDRPDNPNLIKVRG